MCLALPARIVEMPETEVAVVDMGGVRKRNSIALVPEAKVGVFPMQVLSLLQSIAPKRLVNEWSLTGEPFDAQTAQAAGLLNYVVPAAELDAKVDWLIGRLVDKSPTAIRRAR